NWIDIMTDIRGDFDLMSFCGDMANANLGEDDFWACAQLVMDEMENMRFPVVYTTGNHEFYNGHFDVTTNPTKYYYIKDAEAANAPNYRLYCLGTDNFDNSVDNYTEQQAETMAEYFESIGNEKPIFVITHFPLHSYSSGSYWWSTKRQTVNADLIIDTLNDAADSGKTIIFLWGHNHTLSDTYYDRVITPGTSIPYTTSGSTKTLNFYYAAAGCMSDYEYSSGSQSVNGKGLIAELTEDSILLDYYKEDGVALTTGAVIPFSFVLPTDGPEPTPTNAPTPPPSPVPTATPEPTATPDTGDIAIRYVETASFEEGGEYVIGVNGDEGRIYALSYDGSVGATELEVMNAVTPYIAANDYTVVWTRTSEGYLRLGGRYLYPISSGTVTTYTSGREIDYSDGQLSFYSSSTGTYWLTFADGVFGTSGSQSDAADFRLFVRTEVTLCDPVTFTVGSSYDNLPGGSVTLPVTVSCVGETAARALELRVNYESGCLTPTGVTPGALWNALPEDAVTSVDPGSVPGEVLISIECPEGEFVLSGELLSVSFDIASGMPGDQTVSVCVSGLTTADDPPAIPEIMTVGGTVGIVQYNANDHGRLAAFLETEDGEGVKNGEKLSTDYDPNDPSTWAGENAAVVFGCIDGELRAVSIDVRGLGLVGCLDLSGCTELISLDCGDNMLTGVVLTGCAGLAYFDCTGNLLTEIDMSGQPMLWQGVLYAGEGGTVGYTVEGGHCAVAAPDEGRAFIGWFDELGELLCDEQEIDPSQFTAVTLTARFGFPPCLYGDANDDGELTFADISALYAMIIGGGSYPAALLDRADFDRDGSISFGDISALYSYLINQ
ncbi:MAG: metallophosphoesterase, partial [Oscillospiraceae bacterium]|nr:metallophosphoesterase [Oscillospiraceae bacterium]